MAIKALGDETCKSMKGSTLPAGRDAVRLAAGIVRNGGLVVYPTDTVYGLGCDPFDAEAVGRLFEAKKREGKPIPVLCARKEDAEKLVDLGPRGTALADSHWPGALTIVAPLKRKVPLLLDHGTGALGVRVPGHALCRELARECGGWLTGTSANLSGKPPSRSAEEAKDQLGDLVDLYLDGGVSKGLESTVVKVVGEDVVVLRQGALRGILETPSARRKSGPRGGRPRLGLNSAE